MKLKIIIVFLLFTVQLLYGETTQNTLNLKRILVISSFHLSHQWTESVCNEISKNFVTPDTPYLVDYLELNAVRNRPNYFQEKFEGYLPQIKNGDYQMVVAILDDAIKLIFDNYAQIPQSLPIVLCSYRDTVAGDFAGRYPNICGTGGAYNIKATVELGLTLYPDTDEVMIITDDFPSGTMLHKQLQSDFKNFTRCRISLISGTEYSTAQMLNKVAELPKKSLVIFTPWRNFAKDGYMSLEQIAAELSALATRPFLVVNDVLIGHGALGGYINSGSDAGQKIIEIMNMVFAGTPPDKIGIIPTTAKFMVDMDEMAKANLSVKKLPHDAVLLHQKIPFYRQYQAITGLAGVLLGSLIIIILLLIQRLISLRRHQFSSEIDLQNKQKQLDNLNSQYNTMLETLAEALLITDNNGQIIQMNTALEKLLDSPRQRLLGANFDDVINTLDSEHGIRSESVLLRLFRQENISSLSEQVVLITASGNRCHIMLQAVKLHIGNNTPHGAIVTMLNVSAEHEHQLKMQQTLNILATATQMAKITYTLVTPGSIPAFVGGCTDTNWAFGPDGKKLMPEDWVHPDDLPDFYHQWSMLKNSQCEQINFKYRSLNHGEIRYFNMFATNAVDANPQGTYICVVQDITAIGSTLRKLEDSNKLFNMVVDALPCFLLVKNASDNYRFVIANNAWCNAMSLQPENVIGKTDFDLFAPPDAERFRYDDRNIVEHKLNRTYIEELPTPSGIRYIQTTKYSFKTFDESILMVALAADITTIRNSQLKAEETQELLRAIFDNTPVGLLLKDPDDDYRYIIWNAELSRNTGIPVSDVEGKTDFEWHEYVNQEQYLRDQDIEVMTNGHTLHVEEELPLRNGKSIIYKTVKMPITLSSGKRYLMGTFVNITQQRLLEKELQNTIARQNNLLRNEQIYNECLRQFTLENDYNSAFSKCLAIIGKCSNSARTFITSLSPNDNHLENSFDWSAAGEPPLTEVWAKFPYQNYPELWEELWLNKTICINAKGEHRLLFEALQKFSPSPIKFAQLLIAAIDDDEKLCGFIGLVRNAGQSEFTENEKDMLRNCAVLLQIAMAHAKQEALLDDSEYIRQMIFRNIKLPILLFDTAAKIININPAACAMAKLSNVEIMNAPCHLNFCHREQPPENCPVRTCLQTRQTTKTELCINGRDYILQAEPIFDANGNVRYVLENAIDITVDRENRRQLTNALLAAQAADQAKMNFIATMNHELRTPLNAIIGFAELLQFGDTTAEETKEYLEAILNSGQSLLSLINDILDLSKLDADKIHFEPVLADLSSLYKEIKQVMESNAKAKNITFTTVLPPLLPLLAIDRLRVKQILINLISNAIKFTHVGGVKVEFQFVEKTDADGVLSIIITDTGIGIAPESLAKIFDPFVQDEQVRGSRAYQGSGLGLSISQKLAAAMNGIITASSKKGVGSTFTLILNQVKFQK